MWGDSGQTNHVVVASIFFQYLFKIHLGEKNLILRKNDMFKTRIYHMYFQSREAS